MNYESFLATKAVTAPATGFQVAYDDINSKLFEFQRQIVRWALARGRAAIFAACGLGKTPMQLEWARHVSLRTGKPVLVLAPLAVAQQTAREGAKFGITVTICRSQADIQAGVNVTNYEMLHHFDTSTFGGVVLDESSILKSYMGKTKQALISAFSETPYRLCCTATPAPNDHMEMGNHSEFLSIMPSSEMIMRWFINDTMNMGKYRLKGHAVEAFWEWVASWAIGIRRPSDLGYDDTGYILPPLVMHQVNVEVDVTQDTDGALIRLPSMNATGLHREMRRTTADRARKAAELVNGNDDTWIVWCNTNYEADALMRLIPDAIEVRGSDSATEKERKLEEFTTGQVRVIVTKPSLAGFGLNWQHCHKAVFVGLSYSFEQLHQAIHRVYRFGQLSPVDVYLIVAETEGAVLKTIQDKIVAHETMQTGMYSARTKLATGKDVMLTMDTPLIKHEDIDVTLYHGDVMDAIRDIGDATVGFSIHSPPFTNLYVYSDSVRDMGNCADDEQFFAGYEFLMDELYRVTMPGRLCAVHCKQLVNYAGRDGRAGLRDFRGEIIRRFERHGWQYHSEVCIWTDPVMERARTNAHGLLYKSLRADSSFARQGLAEYLVLFRKWAVEGDTVQPITHTHESFPLEMWQRYASPVWFDVERTDVLNVEIAREDKDEKHLCPLQLTVIERAIQLWSAPGDLVFDPFAGIGSTGYIALKHGRRFVGAELKEAYWRQAIKYLERAERERSMPTLFDLIEVSASDSAVSV